MHTFDHDPVGTVWATVPDALLTLLRWCLLALLYLFFFRVLQATWFGAMSPSIVPGRKKRQRVMAAAPSQSTGAGAPPASPVAEMAAELVIIDPPEDAGRTYRLDDESSIGRAAGCTVTLDDTFISQVHARLSRGESGLVVEDLGSTNGTYLNRRKVTAPVVVQQGDRIQVGGTVLELR